MNMWPKISTREFTCGPKYAVDLRKIDEGVKTFPYTMEGKREAIDLVDKIVDREKKLGESAWIMGLAETADAAKAHQLLKDSGSELTLTEYVASTLPRSLPVTSKGMTEVFNDYIKYMKGNTDYKEKTITDAKTKVRRFIRHLSDLCGNPELPVSNISTEDIEGFLNHHDFTKNTRRTYSYCLVMFFKYCVKQKLCLVNPTDNLDIPPIHYGNLELLPSPQCAEEILRVTREFTPRMLISVAIKLFAGVRTHHVGSIERDEINLDTGYLIVPEEKDKNRGRCIKMEPNLLAILKKEILLRGKEKDIGYWSDSSWRTIQKHLDFEVPKNSLRRSYVTYHVAKYSNIPLTSKYAGHTIATLERSYLGLATEEEGSLYFSYT